MAMTTSEYDQYMGHITPSPRRDRLIPPLPSPPLSLVIIGCGVGGHGAALHAVEQGLKVAVIEGNEVGGTCVNRGCVPSKALLAASGRVRDFKNQQHLKSMGVQVGAVTFDRQGIADHAINLASTVKGNLERSLTAIGVVSGASGY